MRTYLPGMLILFLLSAGGTLFAQTAERCATVQYMKAMLDKDPALSGKLEREEGRFLNWLSSVNERKGSVTRLVPVVVHILWHKSYENICDAVIQSQIDVLNEDYGRYNKDTADTPDAFKGLGEDAGIRFILANRDPSGNFSTGITRKYADSARFLFGNSMKFDSLGGQNQWDPDQYLNIWVCNLEGSLLGYATLPGTASPGEDGVVIASKAFGRNSYDPAGKYNLGRTATHEVGHWLNLYHIWGDDGGDCSGNDKVGDTPNQATSTYGCPDFPYTDNCKPNPPGVMFMNYMDYTDDRCMNIFTVGQNQRMQFAIDSLRTGILTSGGYVPDSTFVPARITGSIVVAPNPFQTTFEIRVKLKRVSGLSIQVYDLHGKQLYEQKFPDCFCRSFKVDMSSFNTGVYLARIKSDQETVVTKLLLTR